MRNLIGVIIAACMLLNIGINAHYVSLRFSAPIAYLSAWIENPRLLATDTLSMKYIFERYRYCETTLSRFIISLPDNTVVYRDRVPGGAAPIGKHEVRNVLPLPTMPPLPPGQYIFRTISFQNCSDGEHSSVAPDMTFEIVT